MPEPLITGGTDAWRTLPAEKREAVTHAAVDEFAVHGYDRASMNTLVKAAGISKGSLFHYFRTKGDLFEGIVDAAFGHVKAQVKGVRDDTAGLPLDVRLERLLEAGFRFVSDHPRLATIYFRVLRSGDAPFGRRRLEEMGQLSRRFLAELIADAQTRGEADPALDPERTAWLLDAMLERLLAAWHAGDLSPEQREADRRAWVASFRRLVAHGTRPAGQEVSHG
ncbi:MAG: TetR/AcrR family transcriptional regulator [Candidatus Krumholzibacteriia bacterium]